MRTLRSALLALFTLILLLPGPALAGSGGRMRMAHAASPSLAVTVLPGATPFGSVAYIDQPAAVGNPADAGYDAYPSCTFDTPSLSTTASSSFTFAVGCTKAPTDTQYAAGIRNAIDYVQCRADEGAWALNTRGDGANPLTGFNGSDYGATSVYVFQLNALNYTGDSHEITCIGYPLTGLPLVLQGRPAAARANITPSNSGFSNVPTFTITSNGSTGTIRTGDRMIGTHIGQYWAIDSQQPLSGSPNTPGAVYKLTQLFSGTQITADTNQAYQAQLRYNFPFALVINTNANPGVAAATAGGFAWFKASGTDGVDCTTATAAAPPALFCATAYGAARAFIAAGGRQGHTTDIGGGTALAAECGTYANGRSVAAFSSPTLRQFFTVSAAPGLDPDCVNINQNFTGGLALPYVRYKGLKVTTNLVNLLGTTNPNASDYFYQTLIWADNIHYVGNGCPTPGTGCSSTAWNSFSAANIWTDSLAEFSGTTASAFIRNSTWNYFLGDLWTGNRVVINSTASNYPVTPTNLHADVFQVRLDVGIPGMFWMSGVNACTNINTQNLFSDGIPSWQGLSIIYSCIGTQAASGFKVVQMTGPTKNLFFNHVTFGGGAGVNFNREDPVGLKFTNSIYQDVTTVCGAYAPPILSNATQASPAIFTVPFHNLGVGAKFSISGLSGATMTQLNGQSLKVKVVIGAQTSFANSTFSVTDLAGVDLDSTGYTPFSIVQDPTGGVVTLLLTGISNAAQAVVSQPGHPYWTGAQITMGTVSGMPLVSGQTYRVEVIDADSYYLKNNVTGAYIDSTALGAFISGTVSWPNKPSGLTYRGLSTACN